MPLHRAEAAREGVTYAEDVVAGAVQPDKPVPLAYKVAAAGSSSETAGEAISGDTQTNVHVEGLSDDDDDDDGDAPPPLSDDVAAATSEATAVCMHWKHSLQQ